MARVLREGLEYQDMVGLVKPTLHVDEFKSRMGTDDDVIVISFFVRNRQAAEDLVQWLERGYDFVLDADRSPGEITPNRYLVYVELRRRPEFADLLDRLLVDLQNLTDIEPKQIKIFTADKSFPYSRQAIEENCVLTSERYRQLQHDEMNELREAAGLPHRRVYTVTRQMRELQDLAHITRKE